MDAMDNRRFADFFKDSKYLMLKKHLYNFLFRKRAIEKCLQQESPALILEVGCGISPIVTKFRHTVYLDLSYHAVKILKQTQNTGYYVVADGMHLPFKTKGFSHIISSEVLEYLYDDLQALKEMARILKQHCGCLMITVPHRNWYFTIDDDFVKHSRRCELSEINHKLRTCGLDPVQTKKVLGPLEKITMILVVFLFILIQKHGPGQKSAERDWNSRFMIIFAYIIKLANLFYKGYVWLDAMIMPRSFSYVILIKSIPLTRKKYFSIQSKNGKQSFSSFHLEMAFTR